LIVPEAEYPEALSLQPGGTFEVVLPSLGRVVLATVDLYYKSVFEGGEVNDVRANGDLPAELGSAELAGALKVINPQFSPPLMGGVRGGWLKAFAIGASQLRWTHAAARGHA